MRGSETKREINQNAQTHQWQLRITGDFARYPGGRRRNFSRGREVAAAQRSGLGWTFSTDKTGSPQTLVRPCLVEKKITK